MKRITRKPFYLKNKLFYQTKINLWQRNTKSLGLKKPKWVFIKKQHRRNVLDTFRFSPLSFSSFRRKRVRFNFKNNLYLRKIIRLKYGRLKDYDLYRLFKKSNGYKNFIQFFGSRLDVVLCQLLFPISVYQLRQHLSHKNFLLNGSVVKSPGICLKPLDIISFDISKLAGLNTFYEGKKGRGRYFLQIGYYYFFYSDYRNLKSDEEKKRFILNMVKAIGVHDKYEDVLVGFYSKLFKSSEASTFENSASSFSSINSSFSGTELGWDDFDKYIKQQIIIPEIFFNIMEKKKRFILPCVKTSSKKQQLLGFFNNELILDNFEFSIRNNYIDCVFLGFSEEKAFINNNEKYELHYLYK